MKFGIRLKSFRVLFLFLSLAFSSALFAAEEEEKPLWEYGVGAGYVHFPQYPSSDQTSNFFLPFPTFQYRGKVLRADDREGARAYLFKDPVWSLEMAGGFNPALESEKNDARRGMDDLPWMIELGPQLVAKLHPSLELKVAVFQAISTDFQMTKANGEILQTQVVYRWNGERTFGRLIYETNTGSKKFLTTYFEVPEDKVTAQRPAFQAREGFLDHEISYFQSFTSGKAAFYVGGSIADFSSSVNRSSPLHKSDVNVAYIVGMTYKLGESKRASVPVEQTEGVVNRYRRHESNLLDVL